MHPNAQACILSPRMPTAENRPRIEITVAFVVAGRVDVKSANRLVHHSGASPTDGHGRTAVFAVFEDAAAAKPRTDVVPVRSGNIPQKHGGERAAVAAQCEHGRVGGGREEGDVVVGVGRSPIDGLPRPIGHVFEIVGRVRRGERRQGVFLVSAPVLQKAAASFGSVLLVVVCVSGGSDFGREVAMPPSGRRAAKDPEGMVGVVVAGEDVDEQLRLALLNRRQSKQGCGGYEGAECQTFTGFAGGGVFS